MLNNVPTQVNRSARLITLRHPNAMDCTIFKKVIKRTADETMGGLPTLGGMGMLDSEDEADYEYEERGDAKIVFVGQYVGDGANWNDADTGPIYGQIPVEALIECVLDPEDPDFFVTGKPDLVSVEPGYGMTLLYEVVGENTTTNLPPYTRRYILASRADPENGIG
jgi:hypothetical protein